MKNRLKPFIFERFFLYFNLISAFRRFYLRLSDVNLYIYRDKPNQNEKELNPNCITST